MRRSLLFSILLFGAICAPLLSAGSALAAPSFTAPLNFDTGPNPASVAVGDLTSGGKDDVVTANSGSADGSNGVSVLRSTSAPGDASPSFAAPVGFAAGAHPSAVAIGDLNGDQIGDLAVANGGAVGADGVSVLLNTGPAPGDAPSFSGPFDFGAGANPAAVALADINNDGKVDIAIANKGSATGVAGVSVLLNTSAPVATVPTFSGPFSFDAGANPASIALAFLSVPALAGLPDIVVANSGSASGANGVSVLRNTTATRAGTPTFGAPLNLSAGANPAAVATPDFNADLKADIVTANSGSATGTNGASVLLNTTASMSPTLSFSAPDSFTTGSHPASVINSSLDNPGPFDDGDLLTANHGSGGTNGVSALSNTTPSGGATPTFSAPFSFDAGAAPASIARVDLGVDEPQQVVIANSGSASGTNGVSVLHSGNFSSASGINGPACFSDPGGTTPTTQNTWSTTGHTTATRVDIPDAHADSTRVVASGPGGEVVFDQTTPDPADSQQVSQLFDAAKAKLVQAFGAQASISGPDLVDSATNRGPTTQLGDYLRHIRAGLNETTSTGVSFSPDTILVGRDQSQTLFIPGPPDKPECDGTNTNLHRERFVNRLFQATVTDLATYRLTAALSSPSPPAGLPDTTAKKVKRKTKKRRATFSFTGTEAPTGFECVLVKRKKGHHQHKPKPVFAPCTSPKIYKHLKRGKYTFMVRAVNSVGADPTPATQKLKVRRTRRTQH
jgi:hypothetical protein